MLRELILRNFGWKVMSLALAIAIWLTVKTVSTERADLMEQAFSHLPVQIVSGVTDVRTFKAVPDQVDVTVRGRPDVIKALTEREIHVLVDITSAETLHNFTRRIEVAVPVGVTIARVKPTEVRVEVPNHISSKFPSSP
jgi:hypothetical protein